MRSGVGLRCLTILLSLVWATALLADSEPGNAPAAAASDSESAGEAESAAAKDVARFESLLEKRRATLRQAEALEADAQTAVGDDQRALRARALELRLGGARTLIEMVAVIESMEKRGSDASSRRAELRALVPRLWSAVEQGYEEQNARLDRLKSQRSEVGDAEAAAALESSIQRQEAVLLRILGVATDLLEISTKLDAPSETERSWLEGLVSAQARLASSHVSLALKRLNDFSERKAAGADPATFQSVAAATRGRLDASLQSLRSAVALLDRLGLDASPYRQLLIEATGEITVETIDTRVATELLSRWASGIRESISKSGPAFFFRFILFAVVLTVFWALARFVRGVVARAVEARHLRFSELLKRTLVSLSSGLVLLVGLLVALSQLGIQVGPMLAGLGIAGFVIGFALQDTLGNFASGLMVLIYRPYDVGDMIDCAGGVFGKVSHMSLVSTTILTIDNKTLIVPNSKIWGDVITNVTAQRIRRVDLVFGIGYGDDIPHAEAVLWSILKDHPKVLEDPEPVVRLHGLGESSVDFVVRPWVARDDYWDVYWDITREVKLRFDREAVTIPFPQRDVHFYPAAPAEAPAASSQSGSGRAEVRASQLAVQDEPEDEAD